MIKSAETSVGRLLRSATAVLLGTLCLSASAEAANTNGSRTYFELVDALVRGQIDVAEFRDHAPSLSERCETAGERIFCTGMEIRKHGMTQIPGTRRINVNLHTTADSVCVLPDTFGALRLYTRSGSHNPQYFKDYEKDFHLLSSWELEEMDFHDPDFTASKLYVRAGSALGEQEVLRMSGYAPVAKDPLIDDGLSDWPGWPEPLTTHQYVSPQVFRDACLNLTS